MCTLYIHVCCSMCKPCCHSDRNHLPPCPLCSVTGAGEASFTEPLNLTLKAGCDEEEADVRANRSSAFYNQCKCRAHVEAHCERCHFVADVLGDNRGLIFFFLTANGCCIHFVLQVTHSEQFTEEGGLTLTSATSPTPTLTVSLLWMQVCVCVGPPVHNDALLMLPNNLQLVLTFKSFSCC